LKTFYYLKAKRKRLLWAGACANSTNHTSNLHQIIKAKSRSLRKYALKITLREVSRIPNRQDLMKKRWRCKSLSKVMRRLPLSLARAQTYYNRNKMVGNSSTSNPAESITSPIILSSWEETIWNRGPKNSVASIGRAVLWNRLNSEDCSIHRKVISSGTSTYIACSASSGSSQ
jgi:hypothetical protein